MKKSVAFATALLLILGATVAHAVEIPQLDSTLFDAAKQSLLYFANGDYESAAELLEFADAEELEKYVSTNFTTMSGDVQTFVSVAFWYNNAWYVAVPLYDPTWCDTETLVFRTDDGLYFNGYKYCMWSDVETAYAACDYVTWNEKYLTDSPFIIE